MGNSHRVKIKHALSPLTGALLVVVFAFCVQVFLFSSTIAQFYPNLDEVAHIMFATRYNPDMDWTSWFREGFRRHFANYEGWISGDSTYIRPVTQLFYTINYEIFGDAFGRFLYSNYLLHALNAGAIFYLGARFLRLTTPFALLAALAALLSPAMNSTMFAYPAFSYDILAALFYLLTLICLLHGWVLPTLTFLIIGILTKEVGLFAAIAAAMVTLLHDWAAGRLRPRTVLVALAYLAVVPLWFGLRYVFAGGFEHVSVAQSMGAQTAVLNAIKAMFYWPTMLALDDVRGNLQSLIGGHIDPALLGWLVLLGLNALAIALLGGALLYGLWHLVRVARDHVAEMAVVIFFCGALAFVSLFMLEARYGPLVFSLGGLLLVAGLARMPLVRLRPVFGLLLVAMLINGAWVSSSILRPQPAALLEDYRNASRQIDEIIKKADGDNRRIYVMHRFEDYVTLSVVADFLGSDARPLTVVHMSDICKFQPAPAGQLSITSVESGVFRITDHLPACAAYSFKAAQTSPLFVHEPGARIERSDEIAYRFPNERIVRVEPSGQPVYDYGRDMILELRPQGAATLVFWDFAHATYRAVNLAPTDKPDAIISIPADPPDAAG